MIGKIQYLLFVLLLIFFGCSAKTKISKSNITAVLNNSAEWQMKNFKFAQTGSPAYLHDYGIDAWTNAVFYVGLFNWAEITNNKPYVEWLYNIGEKNQWAIPNNFSKYKNIGIYHADELCIGQFYLDIYKLYKEKKIDDSTILRIDSIIQFPPLDKMTSANKQKWTWCDALFMAPPVYAKVAAVNNNSAYLDFMHQEFMDTYNHLYDKENALFFRDDSYIGKNEKNGRKIFWGRGNGWVVAGIVQILKNMPEEYEHRHFYENLLKEMLTSLVKLQSKDGFWRASLLDPNSYPAPETSATSLITYAIAYGINSGLLSKKEYMPSLEKSWNSLVSVVSKEGKLGYVQPIGADPRKVTQEMTAVYGIGAFLLAGSEMYSITEVL